MHNMCLFFNYCKLTHTDYLICRTNNTYVRPCKKISRTPLRSRAEGGGGGGIEEEGNYLVIKEQKAPH